MYQIAENLPGLFSNGIDLLFLLASVPLIVVAFRRLPALYALYTIGALLAPLFDPHVEAPLYAMPHYVLVLFPGFIVLGQLGTNRVLHRIVLYLGIALLTFFTALFVGWFWVA